jgi:hypothetical protein
MIRILFFLIILIPMPLIAQNSIWVKPNAVWHYDYWTIGWFGFMKIEHSGDTVIQGKNAMHFVLTDYAYTYNQQGQTVPYGVFSAGDFYTYSEGDTVFYLQDSSFQKLFDFSKSTGDSYMIGVTNPSPADQCSAESWTMLTGTGNDDYGYPSITVESYLNANLKLTGTFNNRFGGDYFLPLLRSCDPSIIYEDYIFTFRCFQDDSLVVNPNGVECEYMLTHVGLNEAENHTLYIGPNPTSDFLNIQADFSIQEIEIIDALGKCVLRQNSDDINAQIYLSHLNQGTYLIKVHNPQGNAIIQRIIRY